MMTVQEYLRSSRWKKLSYRIVRNPLTLLLVAPLLIFVVEQRFPSPAKKGSKERRSVTWMNLALLVVWMLMSVVLGLKRFLSIELPLVALSGAIGIWLFYVQHQFQEAYWEHEGHWNYEDAAWEGSSYYKLPKLFQWFTGNIGFHHIHHLSSRIPNYNLERCHNELKSFHKIEAMTLWSSLKSLRLRLWDEKIKKLVSFRQLKNAKRDAIS